MGCCASSPESVKQPRESQRGYGGTSTVSPSPRRSLLENDRSQPIVDDSGAADKLENPPSRRKLHPTEDTDDKDSPKLIVKPCGKKKVPYVSSPATDSPEWHVFEAIARKEYDSRGLPRGWIHIPSLPKPYFHAITLHLQKECPVPADVTVSYKSGDLTYEQLEKRFAKIRLAVSQLLLELEDFANSAEVGALFASTPEAPWIVLESHYWPAFITVEIVISMLDQVSVGMEEGNLKSRLQSDLLEGASPHPAWKFVLSRWPQFVEDIALHSNFLRLACEEVRPPPVWITQTNSQRVPFLADIHNVLLKGNQSSCFILFPGLIYPEDGKVCCEPLVIVEDEE